MCVRRRYVRRSAASRRLARWSIWQPRVTVRGRPVARVCSGAATRTLARARAFTTVNPNLVLARRAIRLLLLAGGRRRDRQSARRLLATRMQNRPSDGRGPESARGRHVRSRCRCSMCPAIHINSRSWLRSSSTHEPSDPPLRVVLCTHSRMCSLSGRDRGNIPVVGPSFVSCHNRLRYEAYGAERVVTLGDERVEAAAEETVTAPSQTGDRCVSHATVLPRGPHTAARTTRKAESTRTATL